MSIQRFKLWTWNDGTIAGFYREAYKVDRPGASFELYVKAEDHASEIERLTRERNRAQMRAERVESTLAEIQSRAWWENALDPQWAARLALARLKSETTFAALELAGASPRTDAPNTTEETR